jgi:putative methionine-R-sulfoxide reductase with GAF domain
LLAFPGFLLSATYGVIAVTQLGTWSYFAALGLALPLQVLVSWRPIKQWRRCCTTAILCQLYNDLEPKEKDDLRITLFVPYKDEMLKQVARYSKGDISTSNTTLRVGTGPGGTAFTARETVITGNIKHWEKTLRKWGMTDREVAKLHKKNRKGYLCIPVLDGDEALAVISLDTVTPHLLGTDEAKKVARYCKTLVKTCKGKR